MQVTFPNKQEQFTINELNFGDCFIFRLPEENQKQPIVMMKMNYTSPKISSIWCVELAEGTTQLLDADTLCIPVDVQAVVTL